MTLQTSLNSQMLLQVEKRYLVLHAEMLLQLAAAAAVVVAELALVGLDLGVLLQVQLKCLVVGAREGAFVAAEHQALEVAGEFGAVDLQWSHSLLCRGGEKRWTKEKIE